MFLNTKVVVEKVQGEVGGVIVEVTKRHIVTVPVEIDIDLATGKANVTTYHADVSCLISADVIDLAPEQEEDDRTYIVGKPHPDFAPILKNLEKREANPISDLLNEDAYFPSYRPWARCSSQNPANFKYPMISAGQGGL